MNKPSFLFNHLYMPNTRIFSTFNSNNTNNTTTSILGATNSDSTTTTKVGQISNSGSGRKNGLNTSNSSVDILDRAIRKIAVKMDLVFETCLAQDTDFPICDSPVWVFGRSYSIHYGKDLSGKDLDELRRTVATCLWCTYRKNFPSIGDTGLTSDRGWGCMIRAGQMLIAKALLLRHLGPNWHWESHSRTPIYLQIVSLFADSRTAPLSIHQIAQSGVSLGKPIGSWLGPNTVAQSLKKILSSSSTVFDIELVISMDSTLIKSEVKRACLQPQSQLVFQSPESVPSSYSFATPRPDPKWKPLMLVIPLRLGLSDLNPSYVPAFRAAFEVKQNIGIIGGRPNHALYFIGYAEDEVIFLDPHTVQPTVTVGSKIFETEKEADTSYHNSKPGRMPFSAMDPSIAVCFYCSTEDEFDSLCNKLTERFSTTPLPLFEICERRPTDWTNETLNVAENTSCCGTSGGMNSMNNSFTSLGFSKSKLTHRKSKSQRSSESSPGSGSSTGKRSDDEFEILG